MYTSYHVTIHTFPLTFILYTLYTLSTMTTNQPKRVCNVNTTETTDNTDSTVQQQTEQQSQVVESQEPVSGQEQTSKDTESDSKKNVKPFRRNDNGRQNGPNGKKPKESLLAHLMKSIVVKRLDTKNLETKNTKTDDPVPSNNKRVQPPKTATEIVPVQQNAITLSKPQPPIEIEQRPTSSAMNDIEVNFQYHYTTIRNGISNIRIDHPRPKPVVTKRSRRTFEEDDDEEYNSEDDEDDDSDYNPDEDGEDEDDEDDDSDEDEDDEDDDDMGEYEPPIEGLPKNTFYNDEETEWIKAASKEVQQDIVERENKLAKVQLSEVPLRFRVLQSAHLSDRSKVNMIRMIDDMNDVSPFSDCSKAIQRMNLLSKIPFDTYLKPPITRDQSPEEIGKYLISVKDTMDKAVFGHAQAKQQIISILAREISNPKSVGNVFAIQGPMGNGKTTLAKEGICKAMGRPFAFLSLGGMQDSAFFTGHSYTYEGSKPGRIVEILVETGCMNPVIYFDELDKVSETSHGEEIIHLLCHLTDSTQNSLFQDKYFSGIEFDLSKATFIFSYNDESRINPILLDRMIKIRTDGFDNESKMTIAKKYLLPSLRTQFNFNETDVVFSDDVLKHIMVSYTNDEKGVRNLKRCLDAILSKCNILRYIPTEQQKEMGLTVKGFKLPWIVTSDNVKHFIEKDEGSKHPVLDMLYL